MNKSLALAALLTASAAFAAPGNFKGTISMYVSSYTPNYLGATKLTAFQDIAGEYQKKYPGIKITFWTKPIPDVNTTVRVKAAAGELFDIYWAQTYDLNSATLPRGVATDLAPYFKQPNPYIPGNKAWQDVMNQSVLAQNASPKGAQYTLSADQTGYTIFYNKDLFKKAGITRAPTSWPELLDAAKKLKAAGIAVMNAVPAFPWWSHHFLSDLYSKDYARLAGYDGAPGQSPLDEAVAISKGILTPKDPRFMSWWPTFKQFTNYWSKDYLSADPGKNYDLFQDFVGGKEAMLYEGSYELQYMKDAGVKFPVGAFNFPKLSSKDTPGATGAYTANAYSGIGSFQFAVSTRQANKTMTPAKLAAVVDWMRFFGTPKNVQRIVAENGSYIPTWPGTTPKFDSNYDSAAAALSEQVKQPVRAVGVGTAAPNLGWGDMQRIFGLYLAGNITLDQAKEQAQSALDRAAKDYSRKNKIDLSKY